MGYVVMPAAEVRDRLSPEWIEFANQSRNLVSARVVLGKGEFLAIGSMSMNSLHPEPLHFEFLLADAAEPACLTPLLGALVVDLGDDRDCPVDLSIPADKAGLVGWAKANGFEVIRSTWLGSVEASGSVGER